MPRKGVEVIQADKLYEFDQSLFGINEMSEEEMTSHARTVAKSVAAQL